MKHGILFFLNFSNITKWARIAILPLIYLTFFQVRPFGVVYFTCLSLLVLSLLLAMIPAPSDRTARRTLNQFYYEHKEEMKSRCGFANDGDILFLYGYEEHKNMRLKRTLGREVIYPSAVALAIVFHLNKGRLLIGQKSLLKRLPTEYFFLKDEALSAVELDVHVESENEEVARLTLTHSSLPRPMIFYVKNDFRVRDFCESVEKAKKF